MKGLFKEGTYHFLFRAGVIIKAVITAVEIVLGLIFYTVSAQTILSYLPVQPTGSFLLDYLVTSFEGLIGVHQSFWAFIFFSHGIVKIFLVVALLKNKLWAYPASAVVFSLFVIYQVYSLIYIPSLFLLLFTIFDVLLIVLILHEYRHKRRIATR